jgi:hypothetical protein
MSIMKMVSRLKPVVLPHGTAHNTPAFKHLTNLVLGTATKSRSTGKRRTRKASASSSGSRKRHRRSSGSKAHLVKGSAAAKKHMASIRKLRGKKKAA